MHWYCKLIGHTYVYKTENKRISWNTGKDALELHLTSEEGEPRPWLECRRCGKRIDDPTPDQVRLVHCNVRN